jgi:hypothetical protein
LKTLIPDEEIVVIAIKSQFYHFNMSNLYLLRYPSSVFMLFCPKSARGENLKVENVSIYFKASYTYLFTQELSLSERVLIIGKFELPI